MRACIVALSDVTTDPRPRRHADLLALRGTPVTVVGYAPSRPEAAAWPYVSTSVPAWPTRAKVGQAVRLAATRAVPALADAAFWHSPGAKQLLDDVRRVDADLYVSHDLWALPIVARVARERGARYAYEAREFYVGQHADRRLWRLLWPAYADAVQRRHIAGAQWVTTVSEGLADWLAERYSLRVRPTVVRSIPARTQPPPVRDVGTTFTVLFHGNLRRDRNVHGVIESVPHWDEHLRLVVRGSGHSAYEQQLRDQVASLGVEDRVSLEPPVPVDRVVDAAAEADIGVIPWPLDLPQKRFSLANKLFEYLAAGLCVVQTGPSESAALVEQAGAGIWYRPAEPAALAKALNSLTREQLVQHQQAARTAMAQLTWERERERLWALYADGPGGESMIASSALEGDDET